MNAPATAQEYIKQGWTVTPVHARGKRPLHNDWPRRHARAEDFAADSNVGVVLGDVSGGLVDIDLDCPEAVELADTFLPPTREFGRASSLRSHRIYYARHARTEKFLQQLGPGKFKTLVEIRANKTEDGEGLQTVFPGSVHESGELVEWSSEREIARIAPEQLRTAVARLAATALLVRSGWARDRAIAFGRAPEVAQLAEVPLEVYERAARWLGFPAREKPQAPRRPVDDNRLKRAAAYLAKIPGAVSGAGGHQQAWAAALAVVRGFDLGETDAYRLLAADYNPRCDPPWSERELQHKVADAAKNGRADRGWLLRQERPTAPARAPEAAPTDWEPPVEFDVFDLPPFPTEALPSCLGDFVRACAEATQTPPDLAGMLVLAASAAACAKRVVVEVRPGYREPVNLFTAVALPPGERKSAVMKEVSAPLIEWESHAAEKAAPEINKSAQRWAVSKKRLDAVSDRAAKAKTKGEREQLELEIDDLTEQHGKLKVAVEPRILADDATPEALASLLALHGGRIAIFSAEGGVFQQMAGKYSDSPTLDVYLKAHAGDEIRVDRKGRPSERIPDPALTLGLAIQPSILEALAEKPFLRGTGLIARFLYALPTSMLGARRMDAPSIPDAVRAAYGRALRSLLILQEAPKPIVLKLSPEAYSAWCEFSAWLEPQLGEFGELESIRDWASKLAGVVARISGVLGILGILSLKAISEDLSISIYIPRGEVVRAIALAKYLVPHAKAVISSMGAADSREEAAKHVLGCLGRKAWTSFSRRDIQQSVKQSMAADRLDRALDLLVERHFIRRAPEPAEKTPGRPSIRFEVNPHWVENNPQNPQNGGDSVGNPTIEGSPRTYGRDRVPGEDDDE